MINLLTIAKIVLTKINLKAKSFNQSGGLRIMTNLCNNIFMSLNREIIHLIRKLFKCKDVQMCLLVGLRLFTVRKVDNSFLDDIFPV